MMFDLPAQVSYALTKLNQAGFEAYLVGGGVRDELMGFVPKDYDITTSALPAQTEQVFSDDRLIETGLKHGTVTVLHDGMPLEITTFRVDGNYSDYRHPDEVTFSSKLIDDLSRRDFTVNALAYHPAEGVVDCFGGRKDLAGQIIRCVGAPEQRFAEDALRILRSIRFSSVLGFTIEEQTANAIHKLKDLLRHVSAERIYSEFIQLLCGKNVRSVLEEYIDVIAVFLPQAAAMQRCTQTCKYHCYDVLGHTACTVDSIPSEPILRLSAFFHDIGKPACRTTDEAGNDHFYGHCEISAQIAAQSLKALRADNATIEAVTNLVLHHDTDIHPTEKSVRRALNRLGEKGFAQMLALKRADTLAHAPMCHTRLSSLDELASIAAALLQRQECFSLRQLCVNGDDLLRLGVPEGKEIGKTLQALLDAVIDGRVKNEREPLLSYLETIKQDR